MGGESRGSGGRKGGRGRRERRFWSWKSWRRERTGGVWKGLGWESPAGRGILDMVWVLRWLA